MKKYFTQSAKTSNRLANFLLTLLIICFTNVSITHSIPTLNLKSTSNFTILAGSLVTGLSPISIVGNVGLSPATGSNITGFDGSNVDGILYVVDATGPAGSVINANLLQTAKSDLTTAYNDAAGRTPVPTGPFLNPGSGNLGGLTLVPGLYKFTSDCQITGSDLTLTGNSTDVWIFQIGTSLNLGSGTKIILAGGAKASNIFWQVGSSATLDTYSYFKGTILADQSISLGTGATIDGRVLAFTGAVTMQSGVKTTSVENEVATNPNLLIFPNPSFDKILVDLGDFGNVGGIGIVADLSIYDILGNEIMTIPNYRNKTEIDVSILSIGTYTIQIQTPNDIKSQRFLISR